MKINLLHIILFLFSLVGEKMNSQTMLNISTGIDDITGQPLNLGMADDTWSCAISPGLINPNCQQPCPIMPTTFPTAFVGNGVLLGTICNPSWGSPDLTKRWISPTVNSLGESVPYPAGYWCYKANFKYPDCVESNMPCGPKRIKSAIITFDYYRVYGIGGTGPGGSGGGAMGQMSSLLVNNVFYNSVASGPNYMMFSIPGAAINTAGGLNDLAFWVTVAGCGSPTQLIGNISTCIQGSIKFEEYDELLGADGNPKSEFCLGESVILDGGLLSTGSYNLDLFLSGSSSPLSSLQNINGSPDWVNITTLFENATNPVVFQPNQQYTIRLTANTSCGMKKIEKTFVYSCCASSLDANFNLRNSTSTLYANSLAKGIHSWSVYTTPNVVNGPYTTIANYNNTPEFSLSPINNGSCYFVKHELVNACGSSCAEQSACNVSCESATCFLQKPINLKRSLKGNILSWDQVPGASSYIIEVMPNDPVCCGGSGGASFAPMQVPSSTNSHSLTPFDLGLTEYAQMQCYSWRVYAVCPDGSLSVASDLLCATGI